MKQPQPSSYTYGTPTVTVLPDALAQLLPPGWPTDVPLTRISTCGHLTVEVLQEGDRSSDGQMTFVYGPPILPHNGWTTALNLLKLLVSQPGRFATKDWLTEKLRRNKSEGEEWAGLARVDNIVSLLRSLLCSAETPQSGEKRPKKTIGRVLVEYVPPTPESGSGYRLAASPLIWVDVEAIRDHIQQACWLEAEGQDARAIWRSAYELANAGPFLAEGWYSDWAVERREEVDGYLWQSVQALWRYAMRQGEAGDEEALRLLREYWLRYPENEDAFRPFVELLGKRGDYQRAEEYYAKLCGLLSEEGKEPDTRTVKAMNFLRSRQHISLRTEDTLPIPFSPIIPQGITESYGSEDRKELQELASLQEQDLDRGTGVGRREVAKYLGVLGLTLFTAPHKLFDSFPSMPSRRSRIDRETLSLFSTLTETCLLLSEGSQLTTAECVLWSYLPEVEAFAQQPSEHQKLAANITSQGYLIAASLVGHHNDLQARQHFSEQALIYGNLAQDYTLQVAALRQLAATFSYLKLPQKVMQTYQCALPFVDNVPPLLRSCIYAALSGAYAQFHQKQDAYRFIGLAYESFGDHQGDEPYFLRAINASQNLLIHWDGKNHLLLGEPRMAENVFMQLDVLDPNMKLPKRIRIEAINNRAKMFIAVRNMEQACMYLEVAVKTSVEIGSRLRLQEVVATFQSLKSIWPDEKRVRELDDLFIQHLVNHVH
jgi:tetratricopeptide (TPR) repeat protein